MAAGWRLTPIPLAVEPRFPKASDLVLDYDAKSDVLSVSLPDPGPAVSIDLDENAWARIVPISGEVVGYEIEAFERDFLPRNAALAQLWQACGRPAMHTSSAPSVPAFVEALAGRLQSLLMSDLARRAAKV